MNPLIIDTLNSNVKQNLADEENLSLQLKAERTKRPGTDNL